ncbi:MAG: hypothetical protein JSV20_06155 [Candidatus Bathyarchaeota archaeon]|nr:MAG: hypothetical protein JSV20_06155 [Candidatus Bathyarchaeota archaeon]
MNYNRVTSDIVALLKNIVGATNVLIDKDSLTQYSHDENPSHFKALPEAS